MEIKRIIIVRIAAAVSWQCSSHARSAASVGSFLTTPARSIHTINSDTRSTCYPPVLPDRRFGHANAIRYDEETCAAPWASLGRPQR